MIIDDKHGCRVDTRNTNFRVDPRIWEISLVKPKNTRKQASLERIPKFLGKPRKVTRDFVSITCHHH